jgi:hypothetical protein
MRIPADPILALFPLDEKRPEGFGHAPCQFFHETFGTVCL